MSAAGAVLLAAGGSTRLGTSKQFLQHHGQTLIRRAAEAAVQAGLAPVVVVSGREEDYVRMISELAGLPVEIRQHPTWERGIGSSIKAGMSRVLEIAPELPAVVLMVCDQPQVTAAVLQGLVTAQEVTGKCGVASAYAEAVGVPALFDRALFPELLELPDDQGAKRVLAAHQAEVLAVAFPDGAIDIDTPADRATHLA